MSCGDLGGGSGADRPEAQAGPLGPHEGPSPQADGQHLIPKERCRGPAHRGLGARVVPAHALQQVCLHLVLLASSQSQLETGAVEFYPRLDRHCRTPQFNS